MNLTQFLLTRIAEETVGAMRSDAQADVRRLAECEAKRGIVAEHPEITVWSEGENRAGDRTREPDWACGRCVDTTAPPPWTTVDCLPHPCRTLRLLALPYASHPDYDEAWRP